MKKTYILCMLFLGAMCFTTQAQTALSGTATITTDMKIVLDNSTPLSSTYVIDISKMGFRNATDVKWLVMHMNNNLLKFEPDYGNGQMTLHINRMAVDTDGWGIADWNAYMDSFLTFWKEKYGQSLVFDTYLLNPIQL